MVEELVFTKIVNGYKKDLLLVDKIKESNSINLYWLKNFEELGHIDFEQQGKYTGLDWLLKLEFIEVKKDYISNKLASIMLDYSIIASKELNKSLLLYPNSLSDGLKNQYGKVQHDDSDLTKFYERHGFRKLKKEEKKIILDAEIEAYKMDFIFNGKDAISFEGHDLTKSVFMNLEDGLKSLILKDSIPLIDRWMGDIIIKNQNKLSSSLIRDYKADLVSNHFKFADNKYIYDAVL